MTSVGATDKHLSDSDTGVCQHFCPMSVSFGYVGCFLDTNCRGVKLFHFSLNIHDVLWSTCLGAL